MKRKYILYPLIILSIIITLIAILFTTIYFSTSFQQKILHYALEKYQKTIPAKISFASLNGNIFKELKINQIKIIHQNKPIITVKSLYLKYSLKGFFSNKIQVSSITLDSARVHFIVNPDSSINLASAFKPLRPSAPSTTSSSFSMGINVGEAVLNNAQVQVESHLKSIPAHKTIRNLNLRTSFFYQNKEFHFETKYLQFAVDAYPVKLSELTLQKTKQALTGKFASLAAGKSMFSATYDQLYEKDQIKAELVSSQINTADLNYWVKTLKLPVYSYQASLKATKTGNALKADLQVNDHKDNIIINAVTQNYKSQQYAAKVTFNNFNLLQLINQQQLRLQGQLVLDVQGNDLHKNNATAGLNLKTLQYQDFLLKNIISKARKQKESVDLSLNSEIFSSAYQLKLTIENIFKELKYRGDLKLQHVNLANVLDKINKQKKTSTLNSDLNLNVAFQGLGTEPRKASLNAQIDVQPSSLKNINIDSASVSFQKKLDHLEFALGAVNERVNKLSAQAKIDKLFSAAGRNISSGKYSLNMLSPLPLQTLTTKPVAFDSLVISGDLSGTLNHMQIQSKLSLNKAQYDSIFVDSLTITVAANTNSRKKYYVSSPSTLTLKSRNLLLNKFLIETVSLNSSIQNDSLQSSLVIVKSDSLVLESNFSFNTNQPLEINLAHLQISLKDRLYQNKSQPIYVSLKNGNYVLKNFNLSDSSASILSNLSLDKANNVAFTFNLTNFSLQQINPFLPSPMINSGTLNCDLSIKNNLSAPLITANLFLNKVSTPYANLDSLALTLKQNNDSLAIQTRASIESQIVDLNGTLPFEINLKKIQSGQMYSKTKPFFVHLKSDELNLKLLNQYLKEKGSAQGFLNADFSLSKNQTGLNTDGFIRISEGEFNYPSIGTKIKNIFSFMHVTNDQIILDSLTFNAGKGNSRTQGRLNYSLEKGLDIDSVLFNMTGSRLHIFNYSGINSKLDANLQLSGNSKALTLNGKISAIDTRVNVTKLDKKNNDLSLTMPLLLENSKVEQEKKVSVQAKYTSLFKQLDLGIKCHIPRNTWIEGKDLSIEMTGDLNVTRLKKVMLFNGNVELLRGYYALYGKRFNIEKGTITFINDKEFNPDLSIQALYRFKEGLARRSLQLNITGTLNKPILSFLLDGTKIEEKDAFSYIVFGKNLDQLTNKQQSDVTGKFSAGAMAGSLLLNNLTGRINDKIKGYLALDMVDITGSNQFGNTEVQVGKYFGNRFFVSYLREFNYSSASSAINESVNFEYQINKYFFLNSTNSSTNSSGLDLIFKWEK